jgi:hypothetical protein
MAMFMEDPPTTSSGQATPAAASGATQSNFLQTLGSGVVGAASTFYQSSITPPRYRKTYPARHPNLPFN